MSATTGIIPLGNYAGAANNKARIDVLLALLPNPDTTSSSGAIAGGGLLDEMSPPAVAQLRVELLAMQTAVTNAV